MVNNSLDFEGRKVLVLVLRRMSSEASIMSHCVQQEDGLFYGQAKPYAPEHSPCSVEGHN